MGMVSCGIWGGVYLEFGEGGVVEDYLVEEE